MTAVERYSSGGPWEDVVGSGTTATVGGVVQVEGDAYAQTITAFGVVAEVLAQAGCTLADVVRTRMYLVDAGDQHAVGSPP